MAHELGHTRPRPEAEELRARINDESYRQRLGLGLVGPDTIIERGPINQVPDATMDQAEDRGEPAVAPTNPEELRARINDESNRQRIALGLVGPDTIINQNPSKSVIDPALRQQLAATDLRKRGGGAPVGQATTEPQTIVGETVTSPQFPPPPPDAARTSFGQDDVPALVDRANRNLQVVPPGASPSGGPFTRPGAVLPSNEIDYERRNLERQVRAAQSSAPRLQYGQHLGDTPGAGAQEAHMQRLRAGNAADALLSRMDERSDAVTARQDAGAQMVRDESGNAYFINPITKQVAPAMSGAGEDAQQLRLPQDARYQQRIPAKVQYAEYIKSQLGVSPEVAIEMANTATTDTREEAIRKWAGLMRPDSFGRAPTPEDLETRLKAATTMYDQLLEDQRERADGNQPGTPGYDPLADMDMGDF